jgi:acetolactate synthase I/III small subunit
LFYANMANPALAAGVTSPMRHIISMLLQNEAGALARVASVLSSRGYNIESLNVAPTADETVSRLTLVTSGSETVIDQIEKQLGKLVDVVDLADMTKSDHIERELALFKLRVTNGAAAKLKPVIEQFGARVLSDTDEHYTVELVGGSHDIDRFLKRSSQVADVVTLVRSGAMAVMRGAAFKRG